MRGAVIGCGFFAQNHLEAWRDLRADGVELVAVCDLDAAKAKAAAEKFGVSRFHIDPIALLATEKLDFIDIITRMETHKDLALEAIARGVRAIVQKPFAPDWADCVAMVEAAKTAGVPLAVHENFRYQRPMLAIRETLDSGVIGEVTWGRIAFRTGYDVYKTQPYFHREARFAILDTGVHVLDLARFFMGGVEHVSCETQRRNPANIGEDTATMMLRHASGAVGLAETTYEARQLPDPFPQTLVTLEGEKGSIKLHEDFRLIVTSDGRVTERKVNSPLLAWTSEPWHNIQESVLLTQKAIIGAWKEGRDADTSGVDNLETFAAAEAAYASAANGCATAPARWTGT